MVNYTFISISNILINKPKMAGFLKFKFLFALKKILRAVNLKKRNIKIWLFQKVGKNWNKVGVTKIGRGNGLGLV